jgi:hypothetical protein
MAILEGTTSVLSRHDATHRSDEKRHEGRRAGERGVDDRRLDDQKHDEQRQEDQRQEAERFARTLNETFQRSSYPPLRRLHATIDADVVELHGVVRTYYQKQIAQQAAMDLLRRQAANQELVNQIEVIR